MLTLVLTALRWLSLRRSVASKTKPRIVLPLFGGCVLLYGLGLFIAWVATGATVERVLLIEAATLLFWVFWLIGRSGRVQWQYLVALGLVLALACIAVLALPNVDDDYLRLNDVSKKAEAWLRHFQVHTELLTMHRNTLAGMLVTFSPMAFAYLFTGRVWWERLLGAWAGLVMLGILLLTNSRSSLVAFGIGILILGLLLWRESTPRTRLILGGTTAIVAVIAAVYLMASGQYQLFSIERLYNENGADRLAIWGNTVYLLGDTPLTGFGPGHFQSIYPFSLDPVSYVSNRSAEHAHNLFLQTYADLGLWGFLAIAGATCLWAIVLWQHVRHPRVDVANSTLDVRQRTLLFGGLASFGAMLAYGLTEHSTWNGQFAPLFWLPLACVAAGVGNTRIGLLPAQFITYLTRLFAAYSRNIAVWVVVAACAIVAIWELIGLASVNMASLEKFHIWQGDETVDPAQVAALYANAESSIGWTGVPVRGEAWVAFQRDERSQAEVLLRQALIHDPHDARSLLLLGDLLADEGDSAQALALWRQANAGPVYLARGSQLLDTSDDTRAEHFLLRAVQIDPARWDGYMLLVRLYERHERTGDSIRLLEQATTYLPHDPRPVDEIERLKKA